MDKDAEGKSSGKKYDLKCLLKKRQKSRDFGLAEAAGPVGLL